MKVAGREHCTKLAMSESLAAAAKTSRQTAQLALLSKNERERERDRERLQKRLCMVCVVSWPTWPAWACIVVGQASRVWFGSITECRCQGSHGTFGRFLPWQTGCKQTQGVSCRARNQPQPFATAQIKVRILHLGAGACLLCTYAVEITRLCRKVSLGSRRGERACLNSKQWG
jgi:hypothetical protein